MSAAHDGSPPSLAPEGFGLLLSGLLNSAMRYADAKEAQFVLCEDCENWHTHSLDARAFWPCYESEASGPPWAGCRGFKHREGTPGPLARWKAASAKQTEEALARLRKAKAEQENDG